MFVNNGKTGTAPVHWGGGTGGLGNQGVGEVDQDPPEYDGRGGGGPFAPLPPPPDAPPGGSVQDTRDGGWFARRVYDDQGNLILEFVQDDNGKGLVRTDTRRFDGNGHETGRTTHTRDDNGSGTVRETTTEHDANGVITRETRSAETTTTAGDRSTITTTTDATGAITGETRRTESDDGNGTRSIRTITLDEHGHIATEERVTETPAGAGQVQRVTTQVDTHGVPGPPTIETLPAPAARAWVMPMTWHATVTRSYTGVPVGANGTWFITANAAARIDRHEELHIAASQRHHDAHIKPLEVRCLKHQSEPRALVHGDTRARAIAALTAFVDWPAAIQRFRDADTAENSPMASLDRADLATKDFCHAYGPYTDPATGLSYDQIVDAP